MKYISIDIETTGLDHAKHQVLEVGAVFEDGEAPLDSLPTFRCLIMHDEIIGAPVAIVMNLAIIEEIEVWRKPFEKKGYGKMWLSGSHTWLCRPHYFKNLFQEWLDKLNVSKPVLAGKNVHGFDLPFLKALGFPPHHRRVLDPAILYIRNGDTVPPNLSLCLERAGLSSEVTHRAVDDAMQVVSLLRGMV
jgi:DNA polymerase III epsilon subunit-like protein